MADFPTVGIIASVNFRLVGNTQIDRSILSGSEQAKGLPGSVWRADVSIDRDHVDSTAIAEVEAFINALQGQTDTFEFSPPHRQTPNGTPTGTPLVMGASQTGKSLDTDGWGLTDTGVLLPGDFFETNGELKQVAARVDSDGSGEATITFHPELRTSPPDDDPIITTDPKGTFRLVSNDGLRMVAQAHAITLGFTIQETFGP